MADLLRLRAFVAVVDHGGYSAAARYLHLAQPTVSHHVRELEKSLNVTLLRYEQRMVRLTPAGHEVYRSARLVLREHSAMVEALTDLRRGRRGRVRLGASLAFEQQHFFDKIIAPFSAANRDILLSLRFGHSGRQAQGVVDRELDLAYVIKWELPGDIHFEPLHTAELTFLAPRDHPLTRKKVVSIDDVADAGIITAPLDSVESAYYQQVLRSAGLNGNPSVAEVDGMQARMLAADAGLGIVPTFIPAYAHASESDRLVPLAVDCTRVEVEIGLALRVGHVPSDSVQTLARWLRQATRAQ